MLTIEGKVVTTSAVRERKGRIRRNGKTVTVYDRVVDIQVTRDDGLIVFIDSLPIEAFTMHDIPERLKITIEKS